MRMKNILVYSSLIISFLSLLYLFLSYAKLKVNNINLPMYPESKRNHPNKYYPIYTESNRTHPKKYYPSNVNSIYIYGRTDIGDYLWEHIMNNEIFKHSKTDFNTIIMHHTIYRYLSKNLYNDENLPIDIEYLILVINARDETKVDIIINTVLPNIKNRLKRLKKLGIIALGSEKCTNEWLRKRIQSKHINNKSDVDIVFIVYNDAAVNDDSYIQWPLGVATYRNFPKIELEDLNLHRKRDRLCNFYGTIYANSSRVDMIDIITSDSLPCMIKTRTKWLDGETSASLKEYTNALLASTLTLCPVGLNAESYRIYESMASGSIPVVEVKDTSDGRCSHPHSILKKQRAPVYYIYDWKELPALLSQVRMLSEDEIYRKRVAIVKWYKRFRLNYSKIFAESVEWKFFKKWRHF